MSRCCALVVAVSALIGCAHARSLLATESLPGRDISRRNLAAVPLEQYGWYSALALNSATGAQTYCGLRDFPPIPNGYGVNRVQCGGDTAVYDHYWMWRLEKVGGGAIKQFTSGEPVLLSIAVPMLPYCQLPNNKPGQMKCGVKKSLASTFILEEASDVLIPGLPFDTSVKPFYLKAAGAVNKYCVVRGTKNSAYIYCDQAVPTQSFRMPFDAYFSVSLNNTKAAVACGSNFISLADNGARSEVNCTKVPALIPSNYMTQLFAGLRKPWYSAVGPNLVSGAQYAFKSHDSLYKYQMSVWGVEAAAPHRVSNIDNDSQDDSQWFAVEKPGATPSQVLVSGDVVILKSAKYDKYCGVSASSQIVCDKDTVNPVVDTAYTYAITIKTA